MRQKIIARKIEKTVVGRIKALTSLATGDEAHLVPSVKRYLADRSPNVRATALDVVRKKELRELNELVLNLLRDKSDLVRDSAVECLGALHEGSAVRASWLYPMLKDPYFLVRIETLESLARIGDRNALPLIVRRLKDENVVVRAFAAESIAYLAGIEFVPAIQLASKAETEDRARVGFAYALFVLGDPSQFSLLLGFLSSADYRARCASANALLDTKLTADQRKVTIKTISRASRHALGVADRSTMKQVEKNLREQGFARRITV
jgi:HEAT repeat protein